MQLSELLAHADTFLREGHALESTATPAAFADALRRYDAAIAMLHSPVLLPHEPVRAGLAVLCMNRGNVLQRQGAFADSIRAYDEAIAFFRTLPLDAHHGYRNSLGAAWMNRGHAHLLIGEPAALAEAARSQREALDLLRTLPLDADRSYGINLAAASLNLANILLALGEPSRALDAAHQATLAAIPGEDSDPNFADVSLKARRASCEALGHLIARGSTQNEPIEAFADEASDVVDDALALARRWEARGLPVFRPIAARLFRFGAQLYAAHLPDFLAEFVLEHLDPARSAGAMPGTQEFYLAAAEAISRARADLETRRTVFIDSPETTRLLERLRDLRAAEQRLAELHARHVAPAPPP